MKSTTVLRPLVTIGELAKRSGCPAHVIRRLWDRNALNSRRAKAGDERAILTEDLDKALAAIEAEKERRAELDALLCA